MGLASSGGIYTGMFEDPLMPLGGFKMLAHEAFGKTYFILLEIVFM